MKIDEAAISLDYLHPIRRKAWEYGKHIALPTDTIHVAKSLKTKPVPISVVVPTSYDERRSSMYVRALSKLTKEDLLANDWEVVKV